METELQEEDDERTPATGTGNAVESGTKSAMRNVHRHTHSYTAVA